MTDSEIPLQELSAGLAPRRMGRINWIGLASLIRKECARFTNIYIQTIITPMVTTLLFFAIFAIAMGGANRMVGNIPYLTFLAPGLIMMSMMQGAFANTSSSIMISKVQGNIVDLLMPPLSSIEILLGYAVSGMMRGLVIGLASVPAILVFTPLHVHSAGALLGFGIAGCLMLSIIGIGAGLWSAKFDHLGAVTNFVIMPLTFLSGTFYSIKILPGVWQSIAYVNPFFYIIDGFRYGMTGHADSNLWVGFGLVMELNIALMIFIFGMLVKGYKIKN